MNLHTLCSRVKLWRERKKIWNESMRKRCSKYFFMKWKEWKEKEIVVKFVVFVFHLNWKEWEGKEKKTCCIYLIVLTLFVVRWNVLFFFYPANLYAQQQKQFFSLGSDISQLRTKVKTHSEEEADWTCNTTKRNWSFLHS